MLTVQNRESIKAAGWILALLGLAAVFAAGMLRTSAAFDVRRKGIRYPGDLLSLWFGVNLKDLKKNYEHAYPKGWKLRLASRLIVFGFITFTFGGLMITR